MSNDPLAEGCTACDAAAGEMCPTATGLHWARAKAAGMTPGEMLAWEGRPAAAPPAPAGPAVVARLPNADDLGIALAALAAACDLAEQHGAPTAEVARLRAVGASVARTDARRAS